MSLKKKPRQLVDVEVVCTPEVELSVLVDPITGVETKTEIIPGVKGTTFIPSVSSEGIISWTNDGDLPNPEPVNIQGPPTTVNGKTGVSITLTAEDVGALPSDTFIPVYSAGEGITIQNYVISIQDGYILDCGTSEDV